MQNHLFLWTFVLFIYFILTLFFGLYFIAPEDFIYFVLASLPIMLFSVLISKADLIDPRVWFAFFGWLYCFSNIILTFGGQKFADANISYESSYLNYIFYSTTILSLYGFSFFLNANKKEKQENLIKYKKWPLKLIIFILCCLLITDTIIVFSSGLTSKRIIAEEGVGLPFIGVISNSLIVAYSLYLLMFSEKKIKGIIIILGFTLFFSYLFTGERDLIAKFVLCTSFALIYTGKIRKKIVYIYGFVFLLLFVLMKDVTSYILNRGDYEINKFDGFKWSLFKGDWASSGSNIEILLSNKFLIGDTITGIKFLVNDIFSGVLPFSGRFVESTGLWYQNNFLYYSIGREVGGLGFSYLGSWYVYFGVLGAFLGGAVYAFVVWFFYYKANKKLTIMAAYFAFAALAIWSLRVGFHGLLTSAINQSLLPLILLLFLLKYTSSKVK